MEGAQVTAKSHPESLPPPWALEEPGDYDGDGTADLLWRNASTGQLAVWTVRAGEVVSRANLALGNVTAQWTVPARGDFDGDGRDDIVLAGPQPGTVELVLLNGSQVLSRVAHQGPGDRWQVVAAPDVDGDGVAEILWQNIDSHALSLSWIGTAGRTAPLVPEPGKWRVLGAADLDGDGRDDLVVEKHDSQVVKAWLLDGARIAQVPWEAKLASGSSYRGLGDFDGDGVAEVFLYHRSMLVIEVWFFGEESAGPSFVMTSTEGAVPLGEHGS